MWYRRICSLISPRCMDAWSRGSRKSCSVAVPQLNQTPWFLDITRFWLKARGWWPRNRSSTKIFFWQFVFLWVNLALLSPIKSFSWRDCEVQATKNKEESCSFLDAIGLRSCSPLSGLAKNRHVGKPKLRLKRIETAGRYATVRFVTLLSLALLLTFESRLPLLCMYRWACYWKRSSRQR